MISVYLPGNSWIHRMPVRLKLLVLAAVTMVILPVHDPLVLGLVLAGVLGLYATLGPEGLKQVLLLKPLVFLLLFIFLLHGISGSWVEGLVAVQRLVSMVLLANLVSVTTRMDDMLEAVRPLFYPLKVFGVSPKKPALAVALVIRFAPVLLSVYSSLAEAYRARTGKRGSWRLIAPFALQALKMSENVAEALTARGGAQGLVTEISPNPEKRRRILKRNS
ncbi:energy-coupling factor transporter transmembrane protein EcfT [uncultured Roseibium sp.]|uniref:energy-coupling factor transporter transmembrane component T family protein n=1 Tax=uncultured Roseibium sp. TaxID=1936171 RepID=UPI003217B3EC